MRKPIVAGNWKMNGQRSDVISLVESIKQGVGKHSAIEVVVFPSFVHIQQVEQLLVGTTIRWGGQNLYLGDKGAFTGEISALMLVDYGCKYVLVGHSERRHIFKEDDALVAEKFKSALQFGLQPVLCVGETLAEREKGQTIDVINRQLHTVIEKVGIEGFKTAVIAYEPVWAIGTGLTATPEQAQEIHVFIRQEMTKHNTDIANALRILYGGSVKADNAASLFTMPDIDGGLVGGASLDAVSFLNIYRAAEKVEA